MSPQRLPLSDTLRALPPEWPDDPLPAIRSALRERRDKVVVLDDDPTGTQTVHGVTVLTKWSVEALVEELANELPAVFLLTNSRGLPLAEARSLNADIGRHLAESARSSGRVFAVVSRSDSTLRGHFPGELEALAGALEHDFSAWIIIPFFLEGGRYTIDDVHYVAEGEWLVPAGDTEYARDTAFAYRSSNLRRWVEEKTESRVAAHDVASISLRDVRVGGPERVAQRLRDLPHGAVCVVNAASMRDLEVFTQGLLSVEKQGRRFLYRTAASFIRARCGLSHRPVLTRQEMELPSTGGALVVVGSHVPRTNRQLEDLLRQPGVTGIAVSVDDLLSQGSRDERIERVAYQIDEGLRAGKDVVVYTSRRVVSGKDTDDNLLISRRVSDGTAAIIRSIATRPRYVLAKGGITASDIANQGLDVSRAMAPGQILPGVPVWILGPESRWPGLRYIVFPGNVGGPEALTETVMGLRPES